MSFGKDYTEEELAQLAELESVFDRLYPANSAQVKFDVSVALLRTYFVRSPHQARGPGSQWCALLPEIHGEAVVRLGQNFRKTKNLANRLLVWRTAFEPSDRLNGSAAVRCEGKKTLAKAWMNGLVEYYKERLEKCFVQLNIGKTEAECTAAQAQQDAGLRGRSAVRASESVDAEQLVKRCISGARAIVNPQMSASPYFVRAVSACHEMVQVLQLVQGLLYIFTAQYIDRAGNDGGGGARRASTAELYLFDDYLATLRTPQWLFRFIFLFLGAMNLLQDPRRDAAVLNGSQLDNAIHCIACLVGEVDGKRKNSDVKSTLDALVLGHVKNSCLSEFPPQQTLDMLAHSCHSGTNSNNTGEEAAGTLTDPLARCGPLLQQLLVRYPSFMAGITNFTRRSGVEEWGVSVMQTVLFCWDVHTPPLATSAEVGTVRYCVPGSSGSSECVGKEFASTVVYSMIREALRPLLSALLSMTDSTISSKKGVAVARAAAYGPSDDAGAEEAAAGSGDASPLLSSAEQQLCALLLGVVEWIDSVAFSDAARMTRWSALDVGVQVMREFNLGRWCMGRVLREVLQEGIAAALQQLEAQVRAAPSTGATTTAAPDDPLAAVATSLLRYLLRVERIWYALTEHTIELDNAAFDSMRAMGVKTMPEAVAPVDVAAADNTQGTASRASYDTGLFKDYKYEFYEAVQMAMRAKWPKAYADLITDPLLYSIHGYLVREESAMQRGVGPRLSGGGGGVLAARRSAPVPLGADGRGAGVKRPLPPGRPPRDGDAGPATRGPPEPEPEAVVLTSQNDLHGALRLVRCIVNRDHFIHRFTVTVRERLLTRPAPDVISDADLEKNKKRCELEVDMFLASWLNDTALLKTVRELHSNYTPQTTTFSTAAGGGTQVVAAGHGKDFKLSSTILDWRLWGDKDTAAAATTATATTLPNTVAELRVVVATQTATQSTAANAPLPFPSDVLPYLEQVEQRYNNDHGARTLRWDWQNHVFTTFTLLYPKENGRVTTVSGPLMLQRLFLAIAAYGRAGVELGTLAKRAGMEERRVYTMLKRCVDRDRLLVRVGEKRDDGATSPSPPPTPSPPPAASPSMRLALNYDYTRPPNLPRGDFTYWPNVERRRFATRGVDQDATVKKRRSIIQTSIMQVMKQVQRIQHDDLYAMVREKNAKRFEVTVRNFKQEIEELIEKNFMARAEGDSNEYIFSA
ncbi:hypothetical protein ABB37_05926 [Leptomonas pyrrhocoris]|uniref:Cullin family profile domain-containing protein n=1 Tax=Leptomonas pyrrhocoris TaxID=157538 RepID=A0A0N0DUG8_LEPPY|nr:hypothetical protein ABB37_05926 [Leptomonas pyrrhocoris]KPA78848.1 hypothetical protein ABB37_05926 [Leptomonas pyrrhocoris]|eukprot:XP_015657287.1 hypothetical protein ABB37_05926 [Leptomonas pyrrhocoris]